jgi:hypothetical protein
MEMTFEDGMQESMLPVFGMAVGDDGHVIVARTGEHAPVYNDAGPIKPDDIGAFIKSPDTGDCILLRDHFDDICKYVREEDELHETGEMVRFLHSDDTE